MVYQMVRKNGTVQVVVVAASSREHRARERKPPPSVPSPPSLLLPAPPSTTRMQQPSSHRWLFSGDASLHRYVCLILFQRNPFTHTYSLFSPDTPHSHADYHLSFVLLAPRPSTLPVGLVVASSPCPMEAPAARGLRVMSDMDHVDTFIRRSLRPTSTDAAIPFRDIVDAYWCWCDHEGITQRLNIFELSASLTRVLGVTSAGVRRGVRLSKDSSVLNARKMAHGKASFHHSTGPSTKPLSSSTPSAVRWGAAVATHPLEAGRMSVANDICWQSEHAGRLQRRKGETATLVVPWPKSKWGEASYYRSRLDALLRCHSSEGVESCRSVECVHCASIR